MTSAIARGNGRSYGDASFGPGSVIDMRSLDRILAFDEQTGEVTCEGGILLSDIIHVFAPRGWFPPVTPGTKFVTLAGMVASDVHGKNHHSAGSFCDHLVSIQLALGDGQTLFCSRSHYPDLFEATCGGMGLTGIILCVTFRMIKIETSRIVQTKQRAFNLASAIELLEARLSSSYSVAWIDCLASGKDIGRSVVFTGEHAKLNELDLKSRALPFARKTPRSISLPIELPSFALSRFSVRLFNSVYYRLQVPGTECVDLDPYFYPLDSIAGWNKMYGRKGFLQYQCVLPLAVSRDGLMALLKEIVRAGNASFLAVLKRLGNESFGLLSFPLEGYTLAMDFPATEDTLKLLDRLDEIVLQAGGRIYLAKDSRMEPKMMNSGYPRLPDFREVRKRYGIEDRFRSDLAVRLQL